MPIDFERVPPRVPVPPPPRPSVIFWVILLVVTVALGTGLTIVLWPKGSPSNTLWFWCCAALFPLLAWVFLFSVSQGIAHARRCEVMAINHVSDRFEQERHSLAGQPLVVLGHGWCFSAEDKENNVEAVLNGDIELGTRPSAAQPGTDVSARWLEIPGEPFYAGNILVEHKRHRAVCDWLLRRLIDCVGNTLATLPVHTVLHVDVCSRSLVKSAEVQARLHERIRAKAPTLQVKVNASDRHFSLFLVDDWHDQIKPREARLLVCLQLRKVVSVSPQNGVAEAGVALLVAHPGIVRNAPPLHLHRPAKGKADGKHEACDLAVRWCGADTAQVRTVWSHTLSEDVSLPVKSCPRFSKGAQRVDVGTTVGDCDGAGAWLATALALEQAKLTRTPQLVLSHQGDDLIALACKTPT